MSLESAPEYALSFSEDAVHLQRRERPAADAQVPGAWRHLGSVEFDSAAFHDEFTRLRGMAQAEGGLADSALPVTLLIPDDQILYTTLTVAPGADREKAVARALDGLTPYAIEDLAFDWEGDGDSVRVAAVARQTLREAGDFARQYGFDGRIFRAAPGDDSFSGEPVFALQAPSRPRPAMDPARAGVTAAALMIEPDPSEDTPQDPEPQQEDAQGALDLDLGADAQPSETARRSDTPAELPAEPAVAATPEAKPAIPTAADMQADDGAKAALSASADVAATETATTETAAATDTPSAEPQGVTEAEASDLAAPIEADRSAKAQPADMVGKAATAEAETTAKVPPVVRHAPVRATHGKPEPAISRAAMNPRAQAVHERAAEARQARLADEAQAPMQRRPGERGGLLELVAMLGALVVGLILIWAFLVPDHEVAEGTAPPVATQTEPAAAVPGNAVNDPAGVAAPQDSAEAIVPEAAPATTPEVAAAPVETAAPAMSEPAAPAEAAPAVIAAPTATAVQAVPPGNLVSALTEEERRRVMVAAAAVAAAVVPPSAGAAVQSEPAGEVAAETATAPTTSPETLPETQPAGTQAIAAAPAPAARPARTAPAAPVATSQQAAVEQALRAAVESAAPARLKSSARPQLAPRRSTPQTSTPSKDAAPKVPENPLPFEATQRRAQPKASARPPERARARPSAAAAPASSTVSATAPAAEATPASAATASNGPRLRGSARPPGRPEGSTPELIEDEGAALTPAEQQQLRQLRRALGQPEVSAAQALPGQLASDNRLAQARPVRKPPGHAGDAPASANDAASASAIDAALRSATNSPPDKPQRAGTVAAPARDSGGLLRSSDRPRARPGSGGGSATGMSDAAVNAAIAAAVDASPATPGGVQLSALATSPLPPRRGDAPAAAAEPVTAPDAAPAAAEPDGPSEAELAERRRLDEQLQAQAEARVRARAQADAQAEAQARAQAEARARAQAEAEERAALASRQKYKPPEVDDEPEVEAAALSKGVTSASVAKSATQRRGMNPGRTTVIGIIGAGKASRALIRLRNGKIVTVRLGDRIDGGTINSIGDGRITYVKSGRVHELRMLDGR
ncbi:hypothetical protein [Paracoccus lutimaris]|uniref:Meckel syndrome type 1 protein n=1 Tax=Paracoccus lutimaris TaxID=1490030 RepID=A0A368Z9G6_9RHOB|nr:hypothetical protein [Paracoccus lutimaris]RCW89041.1 hypothetical protein DFP89_101482 [Paracoccus lutimaris]